MQSDNVVGRELFEPNSIFGKVTRRLQQYQQSVYNYSTVSTNSGDAGSCEHTKYTYKTINLSHG